MKYSTARQLALVTAFLTTIVVLLFVSARQKPAESLEYSQEVITVPDGIAFNQDQSSGLLAGHNGRSVFLLKSVDKSIVKIAHEGGINCTGSLRAIGASKTGMHGYYCEDQLWIANGSDHAIVSESRFSSFVGNAAMSEDGRLLAVHHDNSPIVELFDVSPGAPRTIEKLNIHEKDFGDPITGNMIKCVLLFVKDRLLLISSESNRLFSYDIASKKAVVLASISNDRDVRYAATFQDRYVFLAGSYVDTIDMASGQIRKSVRLAYSCAGIAVDAESGIVAVAMSERPRMLRFRRSTDGPHVLLFDNELSLLGRIGLTQDPIDGVFCFGNRVATVGGGRLILSKWSRRREPNAEN